ncbi:MAG: EF-P beta-lysylation protein EpmB [Thioalkalivibrionaceae bacterium]
MTVHDSSQTVRSTTAQQGIDPQSGEGQRIGDDSAIKIMTIETATLEAIASDHAPPTPARTDSRHLDHEPMALKHADLRPCVRNPDHRAAFSDDKLIVGVAQWNVQPDAHTSGHRASPSTPSAWPASTAAADAFELRVPRHFAALADANNPHDPLTRQFLPIEEELHAIDGFHADPVGDQAARKGPALLQKYAHRALLLASPTCVIHCRYCFRRSYPYDGAGADPRALEQAIDHIAGDDQLHEIILSGGDPLTLSDRRLRDLIMRLSTIQHLRRLRIHTRSATVEPSRVTPGLCQILEQARERFDGIVIVLHVNHPRELAPSTQTALAALRRTGVHLLNQSVLLAGVNDDCDVLVELSETLFRAGVMPYYLHQLDPVIGAAHFAVADDRAKRIVATLRNRLPGYLVPRLVREHAGEPSKSPL